MLEREPVPDKVFHQICLDMEEADLNGTLRDMFKGGCREPPAERTSREKLYESIKPDMRLFASLFIKIFGYEQTTPGFAKIALSRMEILGCSNAKNYYTCIVAEWQQEHEKMLQNVAKWYRKQGFEKKGVGENRTEGRKRREYRFGGLPQDW